MIAKLFTLFCLAKKIQVLARHIKGVDNTLADYRSRALDFLPQDANEPGNPQPEPPPPLTYQGNPVYPGTPSADGRRALYCRNLSFTCIVKAETMRGLNLQSALMDLLGKPGKPSAISEDMIHSA